MSDYTKELDEKISQVEPSQPISRWKFIKSQNLRFGIFLFLFYVLPYLLTWVIKWDIAYSHVLVAAFFVVMILRTIHNRQNHRKIGFRLDTLKPALLWFSIATLLLVMFTIMSANFHWLRIVQRPEHMDWPLILLVYWFLVPFQEFGYRGLLFVKMKQNGIRNPWTQILITSAAFAIAHIQFRDWTTIILTFSVSIIWSWLYIRYPNWLMVTLSHSIVGSVALVMNIV